jgi:hypothetical protein
LDDDCESESSESDEFSLLEDEDDDVADLSASSAFRSSLFFI